MRLPLGFSESSCLSVPDRIRRFKTKARYVASQAAVQGMALSQPAVTAFAVCAIVAFLGLKQRRRGKHLPPGPKKWPIIENLLDMPVGREWETFFKWGKECRSDIVHASALGNSIVALNSYEVAVDLLDKRSGVYSSRPHLTMLHDLSGFGFGFGMLPYGEAWRTSRRIMNKHLNPTKPEINQPREIQYVQRFLRRLLDDPDDFLTHIRHVVGANALSSIYGIHVLPSGDPYLAGAETMVKVVGELVVPGGFLVDAFPFLRHLPTWIPGTRFHQVAATVQANVPLIREVPFGATEEMMKKGGCEPSLASKGLEEMQSAEVSPSEADVELLKDVCAQVFLGAADTTVAATGTFFLAMTLYPGVQKRAQSELDKVLNGRLPEHDELQPENTPYLHALMLEVFRWHPVLPIGKLLMYERRMRHLTLERLAGLPHVLTGDDTYGDYHIPSGSLVIANLWAMLRDDDVYPEPDVFRPERFLRDGKLNLEMRSPLDIAFGFGRRICPGRYLAESMLKITVASVLCSFDLKKQVDEAGKEITPKEEYHLSVVCQPLPFPCRIQPRSREVVACIEGLRSD